MTAKIIEFTQGTELQKARARMTDDPKLFQEFKKSLEDAAEDADFGPDQDTSLRPIDPGELQYILADFDE